MSGKAGMKSDKPIAPSRPQDFAALDQRYRIPRWIRDRLAAVEAHLGGAPSTLQQSLARRLVHVEMLAVNVETQMAAGQEIDVQTYVSLVDRVHTLSKTLGLRRAARDVPSLAAIRAEYAGNGTPKDAPP